MGQQSRNPDICSLHLLPAQVSKARLGSASGPHTCLLHPLLPKGKVRAVVFMGLGTRQALGLRGAPSHSGSEASWFPAPELWAGGRAWAGAGQGFDDLPFIPRLLLEHPLYTRLLGTQQRTRFLPAFLWRRQEISEQT